MTKAIKNKQTKAKKPRRKASKTQIETSRDGKKGNIKPSSRDALDNTESKSKQGIQYKNWCFTWNNYPVNYIEILETAFQLREAIKYVFQPELGENETPHIQGAVWFPWKCRWSEFKLPIQISWENMKKEDRAELYCKKSRIWHGLIEGGVCTRFGMPPEPKPLKCISELRPWQKAIEDICLEEPNDRNVYWYWEPIGNVGKSQFCKYMAIKHNALCIQEGKRSDIAHLVVNSCMHTNSISIVIIDIPRGCKNRISWNAVEAIKNGQMTNMKYKTTDGERIFNPPHVIVFSNFEPRCTEEVSADRVIVTRL